MRSYVAIHLSIILGLAVLITGAIWAKEMNVPAELGAKIGENNAVPTTAVSQSAVKQINAVAKWYVTSGIIPAVPDIADGVVELK